MTERRFESRYLCADLVRVDWTVGDDEHQTVGALLEDISALGGCVQVEAPIPLGSSIMLTIRDSLFSGYVCYCVYRDYGYFVGIRFSGTSEWSSAMVVPQHLTCLDGIGSHIHGF
jgi:hypothetical protein